MRLLINVARFGQGGLERQVLSLATSLRERGHEVLLVVNKDVGGYQEQLLISRLACVALQRSSRWDARLLRDLFGIVLAFRPDVCLCVEFNATLWGRMLAQMWGCPVVVAEHAARETPLLRAKVTNRILDRRTCTVVACANGQIAALVAEGHSPHDMTVIHNGVDAGVFSRRPEAGARLRQEMGLSETAFVVGIAARLTAWKRHDRFVEVVRKLRSFGLDAIGVVVGDGPSRAMLERLVHQSGCSGSFRLLGSRDDMADVYNAMDVAVLTSEGREALPMALLEAQSCSVPVVVMDGGGIREALMDGRTGFLVGQGQIGDMCERLRDLALDPERRRFMGDAGSAWIRESHTLERMVTEYESVLRDAVASGGAS